MCNWTREGNPPSPQGIRPERDQQQSTNRKWHTGRAHRAVSRSQCSPRRAGRMDDLVGPAMIEKRDPWGPSQMSRIPPADRQSISRLLLAAALRHSLSFAISHMVAWSMVAAVHPPLPPFPLPLLPYTRPPIPVPTATKLIHRLTYLRTHIHTYYHNPRLAAFGPPAGCSTLLGACKHVQAWQETCNATSLPRPCVLHRDEWPFAALSY